MQKLYEIYNELIKLDMYNPKYFELYKDYLKLLIKLGTNSPVFNNDALIYKNGNCYSYALDLFNPKGISNEKLELGLHIGYLSNNISAYPDLNKYLYGLQKDLEILEIDSYGSCYDKENVHNGYKIAFFFSKNDFHFVRQNADNSWSHKIGFLNKIENFESLPLTLNNYEYVKTLEIVKPVIKK